MKKVLTITLVMVFALAATCAFAGVAGQKICIDPGHGGSDPGAVGNGLQEKTINLDIGNRMYSLFVADGANTTRTRSTDVYVSLAGRCSISNNFGANRFESTHCNAFNGTAYGTETFSYSSTGTAADLRNKVNPELVAHMGTYNRGVKTASFYVLVNTTAPAILGEVAFIDNAGDAAKLGNATYRQEAARAYLHGTQSHYGEAPHDPQSVADIIIDNANAGFSCSANWSTGTSSTDKYGTSYRFRSTAALSDPATWTPNITVSGSWTVYAWWPQGTNRSPNSAYQIHTTGGDTNVYVNQQVNGGKWNSLGAFNLGTGGYWVKKSCWATTGYVVMADAIKWHKN